MRDVTAEVMDAAARHTADGTHVDDAPPWVPGEEREAEDSDLYPLYPLCPQSTNEWPTIDGAAFYGLPGEVVDAIGQHTEADPVALLVTYLTAFGAAVGRGPHAVADGAEHAGRLFAVLVGDTSKARKGTSWAQIRRVFVAADRTFTDDRILGGFGSGEALVDAVAADGADHRLLVIEPEWARILSVGKREGSTLSPLLRQAWDGDRLAVRSRGGGSVTADNAHVSVLGHVTAEELRAKLTDTEVANGYANRHLFVSVRRSKLLPSGGSLDDQAIADLGRRTKVALDGARKIGTLKRSPAAEERWTALYYEMAKDEPGGLLGAVIARDAAQVLRLSVLFALSSASALIDVSHIDAAWAVWQYCRKSAALIFGDASGSPVADKLIQALRDAGPDGLDGRQMDRVLGGHVSAGELRAALSLLDRRGLIVTRDEVTRGRPRRVTYARPQSADKADKADKGSRS